MYISVSIVSITRNHYKTIKILCGLIKINKIILILVDDLNILKYGVQNVCKDYAEIGPFL